MHFNPYNPLEMLIVEDLIQQCYNLIVTMSFNPHHPLSYHIKTVVDGSFIQLSHWWLDREELLTIALMTVGERVLRVKTHDKKEEEKCWYKREGGLRDWDFGVGY